MTRLLRMAALAAVGFLVFASGSAQAQSSGKPLRIIVPFPPGGSADILARLVGQEAARTTGQTLLIENRPGGGTVIGTEIAARAAPDGNTLLIMANSFVINGTLRSSLPYDPLTSFAPICQLVQSPQVLVVNAKSEFRTVTQFLDAVRRRPGELSIATVGPATTQHIAVEQFLRVAQLKMIYVPYPGGAPAVNAILGDHVNTVLTNYSEMVEQLKAGSLRPLAVASPQRIEELPEIPTIAESGYKDYQATVWFGLVTAAGAPKETVARLIQAFPAALQVPEIQAKLKGLGLYPAPVCGDAFDAHIKRQHQEYGTIIREANIKGE
jgi:tripartite-type tricarboxylate transporter receptor subunit TctC